MIVPMHLLAQVRTKAERERIAEHAMRDRQRLLDAIRDAVQTLKEGFPMTAQKLLTKAAEEVLHGVD